MNLVEAPHSGDRDKSVDRSAGVRGISVLVDQHRRFLAYLTPRVRTSQDAEEILQTAFAKMLARQPTLENKSVVAWFYSVLRNALADYYRRQDVERRALGQLREEVDGRGEAAEQELERTICACINELIPTLKSDYAELIRRVDLEGGRIADVAGELGITANNAAVRLHRARVALKRRLEESCRTCAIHGCLDCTCK